MNVSTGLPSSRKQLPDNNAWLLMPTRRPASRMRLFCFPYGGGSPQIFFSWANRLPDWIEVCPVNLPGRSKRMFEPAFTDMDSLQNALVPQLPLADKPFAVFGHSLGAQIAFELAHRARERYGIQPLHVFVSGCFAPHLDHPHPIHHLQDAEFLREIRDLGGVPKEVADDSELMDLMKPMLRADFTVAETYHRLPQKLVSCPITAFAGENDPIATPEAAGAWAKHTSGAFELKRYPGDHFFIHKVEQNLIEHTAGTLRTYVSGAAKA